MVVDRAAARRGPPDRRLGARGARRRGGGGRGGRGLRGLPLLPAGRGDRSRTWLATGRAPQPRAGGHPARAGATAARPGRRAGPPDAAAERRHHGQGGRGHRVLSLRPVHRPQRGRRRPGALRDPGRGLPRAAGAAATPASRGHDQPVHPRHQARRGRTGAAGGAHRAAGASGRASPSCSCPPPSIPSRPFGYFLAQTLVGTGPIERERMHAYAEKAMREASDGTTWTEPGSRLRGRRAHGSRRRVRRRRGCGPPGTHWTPRSPRRAGRTRWAASSSSSPCRESPTSTRAPSCGRTRSSTRTTGGRSTSTCAAGCWPISTDRRPSTRPGRRSSGSPRATLRLRRAQPELFTDYRSLSATGPAAGHLVAFERSGALTLATRLPVTLTRTGGWRDTARRPRRPGGRRPDRHAAMRARLAWPTCWPPTRSPSWSASRDGRG